MRPRVSTPKLLRRNDRWYVRVQVPKDMQGKIGRKEYWISLKTSDRIEAMEIVPEVVRKKRMEITRDFNRRMEIRREMSRFTEEQYVALFRDEYDFRARQDGDLITRFEISPFDDFVEFTRDTEIRVEKAIAVVQARRGETAVIDLAMKLLASRNGIEVKHSSQAEKDLRKICVDSFVEWHRNTLALMRGQAVHPNANPLVVDADTGKPKAFTPLHELLSRPSEEPMSLLKLVEAFIENPNKQRTEKTKKSIRGSMETVVEILGDRTPPEQITEADCERVRDLLRQLPPNFKKLPLLQDRTIEEMVKICGSRELGQLSPTGVNTYLKWLTSFLNWCQRKGHIAKVPTSFSEIKVADPERRADKRLPFSNEQLQQYFQSRIFQNNDYSNCIYWVSLIALWNGMRSNEICQLDVADITEVEGVWGFDVTNISALGDQDKKIKTGASIRLVPIHPRLIEFGFLDFYHTRPSGSKLFGDITCGADGYYSSTFSKKSNRYLAEVGVHGPKHKFHSFRHNFRDALRRGRVDREIGQALGGWQRSNTSAFDIYGSGFPLEDLADELRRVDYPKVSWNHLIKN